MKEVTVVTTNENKFKEIEAIVGGRLRLLRPEKMPSIPELQSYDLQVIVRAKAWAAFAEFERPVLVEDVALDVSALGGQPGPFVKFWGDHAHIPFPSPTWTSNVSPPPVTGYATLPVIAKAMNEFRVRARCGVAYIDQDNVHGPIYREGSVSGMLTHYRSDAKGFGFDPYFIPNGCTETFAEMGMERKNGISHRGAAFRAIVAALADGKVEI